MHNSTWTAASSRDILFRVQAYDLDYQPRHIQDLWEYEDDRELKAIHTYYPSPGDCTTISVWSLYSVYNG